MIIYRAFAREAARNTAAISLVLAVVMGFIALTLVLERAVSGDLAEDIVLQILGLEVLRRFDLLLTLGLFLGVLVTTARWYRDSEMTVLAACGIGLVQLLRPVLIMAGVFTLAIAALAFHFTPWAYERMERLKHERERQVEPMGISPGMFSEATAGRIFYAERVDRDTGQLGHVFLAGLDKRDEGVVLARRGYVYNDERTGERFMALVDGNLYRGVPSAPAYSILKFQTLHVRLETKPVVTKSSRTDSLSTAELFAQNDRSVRIELQWRLSKPITAMVLVLFAMAFPHADPRRGRMSSLFAAILAYLGYSYLLALGETLLVRGHLPLAVGMWWVHALMLVIAGYLFSRRAANRPLLDVGVERRRAVAESGGG